MFLRLFCVTPRMEMTSESGGAAAGEAGGWGAVLAREGVFMSDADNERERGRGRKRRNWKWTGLHDPGGWTRRLRQPCRPPDSAIVSWLRGGMNGG